MSLSHPLSRPEQCCQSQLLLITSTHLHRHETVVDSHFLGQKVGADGGLVLVAKLLCDVLVHERGLTHAGGGQGRRAVRGRQGMLRTYDRAMTIIMRCS